MRPAAAAAATVRRSRRRLLMGVAVLLSAAACLVLGLRGGQDPPAGPAAFVAATAGGGTSVSAAPTGTPARPVPTAAAALARSVPVALRIPVLDLAVPLSQLGLNPDRTVQVPTDFQRPGWFRLGPTPGEVGSAVILGHVDSYRGPAVFFRLRSLRPGDKVEVGRADGTVARFVVTSVETYLKRDFPARRVYASRGYPALRLVTCGGDFDTRTRSYLSNIVAYASLVAPTPTPTQTPTPVPAGLSAR